MPTGAINATNRRQHILDTTLALVAEVGLLQTSIKKISDRAKSSAGIIYHYFESKDEIMNTLYLDIVKDMADWILDDETVGLSGTERLKRLWIRIYEFHARNRAKTVFLEEYKNSSYHTPRHASQHYEIMGGLTGIIQSEIDSGLVKDLPLSVIYALTSGAAINLAKLQIAGRVDLDETMLNDIAERVCRSILA